MSKVDVLIRGGQVVIEDSVLRADIAVSGGKIVGIHAAGSAPDAERVIDASGKVVLPGVIDTHTHHREPGFEAKEDITTATAAGAVGGVTVSLAMPNVTPPPTTVERYRGVMAHYPQKAHVDYNMNASPTNLPEVQGLADEGILAFKIFMVEDTGRDYPHMPGTGVHNPGKLYEIMKNVAKTGRPLMVHPHNQELMDAIEQEYWARGEHDPQAYAKAYSAYNGIIWDTAVYTLLRLQEATGVHLHILHVSTRRVMKLIREAKQRGQAVTCEANPWVLFLTNEWSVVEKLGPYSLSYYTPPEDAAEVWNALRDGTIDVIATDHAPHTREEKEIGWTDMWKSHSGTPHIQFYLSLLLDAVNAGKLTLPDVARLTARKPAEIFGIYPKKGAITVGADADLVVVDMEQTHTITNDEVLSRCGWTPYDGRSVKGVPQLTMLRGRVIAENGKVVGKPGDGELLVPVKA